jgi:hypothetical protein
MFVLDRIFKAVLQQTGKENMCGAAARLLFNTALSPETNMRRRVLTVLAASLMAAVTIQTAAAARHGRKPARASATQQLRDSRPAAPAASDTKSCDVFWCYQN